MALNPDVAGWHYPTQTRDQPHGDFENRLGDALEAIFRVGTHDLPGIVAALNQRGLRTRNGLVWTEETFRAEMAAMGH